VTSTLIPPWCRRLHRGVIALVYSAALGVSTAFASTVVVPDDYASVQSAIASPADTVLIREGAYPERLVVDHPVVLQGIGPGPRPRIQALEINNTNFNGPSPRLLTVSDIDFSGRVYHDALSGNINLQATFSSCSLDSGFSQRSLSDPVSLSSLRLRNCRLGMLSSGRIEEVSMDADTVSGCVSWSSHDITIRNCWFAGGAGVAMDLTAVLNTVIQNNRIEGYLDGLRLRNENSSLVVDGNTIYRCPGKAIDVRESGGNTEIRNNEILNCGTGIYGTGHEFVLRGNRILRSIYVNYVLIEGNVVGNGGGAGIRVEWNPWSGIDNRLRSNTIFGNAGSGMELIQPPASYWNTGVENNVSAGNGGWGLSVVEPGLVYLVCNDWFDNGLGGVHGVAAGTTDLNLDPMFCDVANADVSLNSASPLLSIAG
jgi:hypothetical protein